MSADSVVWLGTPQGGSSYREDLLDPYTTKVGGRAVLFRMSDAPATQLFACPNCHSVVSVSLLAQLYAPLECYDRVLYILTCAKCASQVPSQVFFSAPAAKGEPARGKPLPVDRTSFCFAIRSQNFSKAFYDEQVEAHRQEVLQVGVTAARVKEEKVLFEENADWDDDDDADVGDNELRRPPSDSPTVPETSPVRDKAVALPEPKVHHPLAMRGTIVDLKGKQYTDGIPLDLFPEPERKKENLGSMEQQLFEAQKVYGDGAALDVTSIENDDELPQDRCVRKYVERIGVVPSQCVRWCPGGQPLLASLTPVTVPPCPVCSAPRRFELQLTAPLVYYLTRNVDEKVKDTLHFSNVLVYTCSKNCYDSTPAYTSEYVVVNDEI